MEEWARKQPPYKTMLSLCCDQIIALYNSKSPINQTSVETICHFLTLAVYRNHTAVGVMDFQNLAPVDLAWWIDGFMTAVITIITIVLNTISIVILTSSTLRSPTNAILAMISGLDMITCMLRAPLLMYVYLFQGYKQLPSMGWCAQYNYIHNFAPSALHSTAFLLNMGLSVQRWVGVADIRRLRAVCCYKGTMIIALTSFCLSAIIHTLYPVSYTISPVLALGKQMLATGKLEEVETCKVSARYPDRFETLSTTYAWARISALQLLPGIVMCVCNISLIAISYKTYNYRRRLIGAIGTIMTVNKGFEGDGGDDSKNKTVSSIDGVERKIMLTSRGDGTEKADGEFQFSVGVVEEENLKFGDGSEIDVDNIGSSNLEETRCVVQEPSSNGYIDTASVNTKSRSQTDHGNDGITPKESERSSPIKTIININGKIQSRDLHQEEKKIVQKLDKILDGTDGVPENMVDLPESSYGVARKEGANTVVGSSGIDYKKSSNDVINNSIELHSTPGNKEDNIDDVDITNGIDINKMELHNIQDTADENQRATVTDASLTNDTETIKSVDIYINGVEPPHSSFSNKSDNEEILSESDTLTLRDSEPKTNAMIFKNGIYEDNMLDKGKQILSIKVPDLKDIAHNLMHNGKRELFTTKNDCPCLNNESENDALSHRSSPSDLSTCNDGEIISINCAETERTPSQTSNSLIIVPAEIGRHQDSSFLSAVTSPQERKGSDISSIISSTIIDDTIVSETLSESYNHNKTKTTTKERNRNKPRVKNSPNKKLGGARRGRGSGGREGPSVAELRPTIMLVLVTSCTLVAELMVTIAIFINFMNQVVDRHFLQEDTLITFILVSNLITMISFPINFVFFAGLSRPFRNTLVAYTRFVIGKLSTRFSR